MTAAELRAPLALSLTVLLLEYGLAAGLGSLSPGTRAIGAGASFATLAYLGAGYAIGRLGSGPRRGKRSALRAGFGLGVMLWLLHLPLSALLGLVSVPEASFAPGSVGRGLLSTGAVGVAPVVMACLGAGLGAHRQLYSTRLGVLGAALVLGFGLLVRELAVRLLVDPDPIGALVSAAVMGAALAVGFSFAWLRRSLAFVEGAIVALGVGYTLYLGAALGPPRWLASWSLPIEQILLALSVVPSVALYALFAVGASLGFVLFGSGRFDASFGYELAIAQRYLQVNLQGAGGRLTLVFGGLICAGAGLGAGLYGHAIDGIGGAVAGGVAGAALLCALVLPLARGRPLRAVLLSAGVFAVGAAGLWVAGSIGAAVGLSLGAGGALGLQPPAPPRAKRRPPFVGVVTILSVVGVATGVVALIVVLSVMSGFEADLKGKILGAHAHVVVEKLGDDFAEYGEVEVQARASAGVRSAAAFVLGDAMISTDAGLSGTLVKGLDIGSADAVLDLEGKIERGRLADLLDPAAIPGACGKRFLPPRPPPVPTGTAAVAAPILLDSVALAGAADCPERVLPGIVIGRELSRSIRAYVGDVVKLVSPVSEDIGPLGPTPKLRRFRVAGIFYSGMYEYDAKLSYLTMTEAQRFFGKRGRATGVELKVEDIDRSGAVVAELHRRLGGPPYRVKDWREMNKELFSALLLEKIAMFVALTMIITVASFLIVATLLMIVLQRGREIAILKSLGASSSSIMKIFVVQGVTVGVGGALLGVGTGIGICLLLEKVGLRLDERIFYIERLPVVVDWGEVGAIAAAAVVITYLATIYPAMIAAALDPVEGLRED